MAVKPHDNPPEGTPAVGSTARTGPHLDFGSAAERADYFRLTMFILMLHDPNVVAYLRKAMQLIPSSAQGKTVEEDDRLISDALRAITRINPELTLGTITGGPLGERAPDPSTAPPGRTTVYSLAGVAKAIDQIELLAQCARRLPAHIFPPEAVPTGEFIVRCQTLARS
jgi:hypothetical protein